MLNFETLIQYVFHSIDLCHCIIFLSLIVLHMAYAISNINMPISAFLQLFSWVIYLYYFSCNLIVSLYLQFILNFIFNRCIKYLHLNNYWHVKIYVWHFMFFVSFFCFLFVLCSFLIYLFFVVWVIKSSVS